MYEVRRFSDLSSLPDEEFYAMLAQGLSITAAHVARLSESIRRSAKARDETAAEILESIASEEVGKFLILVDAARMDLTGTKEHLHRQLKRCSNHLAKALYFKSATGAPASFGELRRFLDSYRDDLYLDGPSGFDWIFRNELIALREDAMYVDLHKTEDSLSWHDPGSRLIGTSSWDEPQPFILVSALAAAGVPTAAGLEIVNTVWKGFIPHDDPTDRFGGTRWSEGHQLAKETLLALANAGLAGELSERQEQILLAEWTFPIHGLDLDGRKVRPAALARERALRRRAFVWDEADYDSVTREMFDAYDFAETMSYESFYDAQRAKFFEIDD